MKPGPKLTVDGIAFLDGQLVLVRRKNPPFQGLYALPGGFVESGESVETAVIREFLEETGLQTKVLSLCGVYSEPGRDPRGHTVTVVFELEIQGGTLAGGDDAAEAKLFSLDSLPKLAFDHGEIIAHHIASKQKK